MDKPGQGGGSSAIGWTTLLEKDFVELITVDRAPVVGPVVLQIGVLVKEAVEDGESEEEQFPFSVPTFLGIFVQHLLHTTDKGRVCIRIKKRICRQGGKRRLVESSKSAQ